MAIVTAGQRINASDVAALQDPPGAQVWRSTAAALSAGVPQSLALDTEDFDNDGMHSGSGSTLTCVTPGRYLVSGQVPFDAAVSGQREVRLVKNGVTLVPGGRVQTTTANAVAMAIPAIEVSLIAGDTLEIQANSATACNTTAINGLFPILRARRVGP